MPSVSMSTADLSQTFDVLVASSGPQIFLELPFYLTTPNQTCYLKRILWIHSE